MNKKLILTLTVMLGAALAQAAIINDTFGDGDPGTNPDDGTGVVLVSNGAGGVGTLTESGGVLEVRTSGAINNSTGYVSNDTLPVTALETVVVIWDIAGFTDISANGVELNVQQGTTFRPNASLNLRFLPDGSLMAFGNGNNIKNGTFNYTDAADGFTATLTADASGWQFDFAGLGSTTSISHFGLGGLTFDGLFNGARVASTVQGVEGGSGMDVNSITANVIPEPATMGLFGIGAAGMLIMRRRHRL